MLISSLLFTQKKKTKRGILFAHNKHSEELSEKLEKKGGRTTNG
jgi:hypothetical protein